VSLLIICLFACGYSAEAGDVAPQIIKYVIKGAEDRGERYVGNLGQLSIHSDLIRDEDDLYSAIINMHDIDRQNPLISYARVFIYGEQCTGTPVTFISYAEVSGE